MYKLIFFFCVCVYIFFFSCHPYLEVAEDVDKGVLLKLDDFLELSDVKQMGVTEANTDLLVVPSIHIVANPTSKSSPIRLAVTPNRVEVTTKQSINSALHSGSAALKWFAAPHFNCRTPSWNL